MRKYLEGLYRLSAWTAAFFIAAICALVIAQVLLNLIDKVASATTGSAIGLTIPSYADFTGFFLAAASFLALAYTLREGGHIRVTLFMQNLSKRRRRFLELWSVALAATITIYFTCYTFLLTRESFIYNDLSAGMVAMPLWVPQSCMLAGLIVLSVALVDELLIQLSGGQASYADKGENLFKSDDLS